MAGCAPLRSGFGEHAFYGGGIKTSRSRQLRILCSGGRFEKVRAMSSRIGTAQDFAECGFARLGGSSWAGIRKDAAERVL